MQSVAEDTLASKEVNGVATTAPEQSVGHSSSYVGTAPNSCRSSGEIKSNRGSLRAVSNPVGTSSTGGKAGGSPTNSRKSHANSARQATSTRAKVSGLSVVCWCGH